MKIQRMGVFLSKARGNKGCPMKKSRKPTFSDENTGMGADSLLSRPFPGNLIPIKIESQRGTFRGGAG